MNETELLALFRDMRWSIRENGDVVGYVPQDWGYLARMEAAHALIARRGKWDNKAKGYVFKEDPRPDQVELQHDVKENENA